jgi:signal transduction histidine kinase
MWKRSNLRQRIYATLSGLVGITFLGGLVMFWYTYRVEEVIVDIIDKNVAGLQTAEALETAIVNQKGFVSYYYLDGDPDWLRQLDDYRRIFSARLKEARQSAQNQQQTEAIEQIQIQYEQYITLKDQVIAQYKAGERNVVTALHRRVRSQFFTILDLCEKYKEMHIQSVLAAQNLTSARASQLRTVAGVAIAVNTILAFFLAFILIKQVLNPITRLLQTTSLGGRVENPDNVVVALGRSVEGLIQNVDQTQSELAKSREHLLQVEKMAMVGKLAAGMAHSIRNPFTSVKMRLFSLGRTLNLNAAQKEDFDVISGEIRHIDTIVQNFLEFSRPPKLAMQSVNPSSVVDNTLKLLTQRLKSYNVNVQIVRARKLPDVSADPEQLKEVFVNLFINACEAMGKNGTITVHEDVHQDQTHGEVVQIRISDDGPGIPSTIIDRVLEPFFTTKEEGTGLGLSIASRIIEEHGGRIEVSSVEYQRTTFTITLPAIGDTP